MRYTIAGNTDGASTLYSNSSMLYDVTVGYNGSCGALLCSAAIGYDGPSGLGTPNGLAAFF